MSISVNTFYAIRVLYRPQTVKLLSINSVIWTVIITELNYHLFSYIKIHKALQSHSLALETVQP